MSAQLQIYKCITLECPYRNKGFPKEHSTMLHMTAKPKKGKAEKDKDKKKDNDVK